MLPKLYSVYQQIGGRKVYVAVVRWAWAGMTKDEAKSIANDHLKAKYEDLVCREGYVDGKDLYFGGTDKPDDCRVWIVYRKDKRKRG